MSDRSGAAKDWRGAAEVAGAGALAFLLAYGAMSLARQPGNVASLWLANAVPLAALLLAPPSRHLPHLLAFLLAKLVAGALVGDHPAVIVGFAAANLAEVVLAARLIRAAGAEPRFDRLPALVRFTLAACVAGPTLSATIAAGTLAAIGGGAFATVWPTWAIAAALGNATLAPLLVIAASGWRRGRHARGAKVRAWPLLAAAFAWLLIFGQTTFPLGFLILPVALGATLAYGTTGAAVAGLAVALIGGVATTHGSGPMVLGSHDPAVQVGVFQLLVATVIFTCLPIAAIMSERAALAASCADSERRHREIVEQVGDVVYTTDREGRFTSLNPAWEDLVGEPVAACLGRSYLHWVVPEDRAELLDRFARLRPGDRDRPMFRVRTPRGRRHMAVLVQPIRDEEDKVIGTRGTMRDVSDRVRAEEGLRLAALTDPLTGLANRRAFSQSLEEALAGVGRSGEPLAVAMVDVDHFKRVNDTHGHTVGDEVLKRVASSLSSALRRSEICARLGGEEFAVLLPGADEEAAQAVCERLRRAIRGAPAAVALGAPHVPAVTASIGVAVAAPGEAGEVLLDRADRALYRAKNDGRDRVRMAA